MREAMHYTPHEAGTACHLCPQKCIIAEGRTGFCRVRKNIGGRLFTLNYAACTALAMDPIEKKPLYHFYPGTEILSLGTWGCNFACQFCQNWEIAQNSPHADEVLPEQAALLAIRQPNNIGIAYTYSEPSVWYEYILDTAKIAKTYGLKNVLVTNGFISREPLEYLLPYIDAMNIDVKAFTSEFYHKICAGELESVKATVEIAARACHVEITTLIIPGLNDDAAELAELAEWISSINKDIPLHLSRYFPNYKMDELPTPLETMKKAYEITHEHLNYVYLGNVGSFGVNTLCPACGKMVIDRVNGTSRLTEDKRCGECGKIIPIIGEVY